VLGFAWVQGSTAMVAMVLLSLALGITLTIGVVAVVAILARNTMGATLAHRLPMLERHARLLQALAAIVIIAIGVYTLTALWS
jgi:ABC-type nickel/cobalt efflux system permease component RcnA